MNDDIASGGSVTGGGGGSNSTPGLGGGAPASGATGSQSAASSRAGAGAVSRAGGEGGKSGGDEESDASSNDVFLENEEETGGDATDGGESPHDEQDVPLNALFPRLPVVGYKAKAHLKSLRGLPEKESQERDRRAIKATIEGEHDFVSLAADNTVDDKQYVSIKLPEFEPKIRMEKGREVSGHVELQLMQPSTCDKMQMDEGWKITSLCTIMAGRDPDNLKLPAHVGPNDMVFLVLPLHSDTKCES